MALKIELTSEYKIPKFLNKFLGENTTYVYIRIDNQQSDKINNYITVNYYKMTGDDSLVSVMSPLMSNYFFSINLESKNNIYQQGYNYLKSLPEFEGAIDC